MAHANSVWTTAGSLKSTRTADPCGHICTHAGPSSRPTHRSHFVANSISAAETGAVEGNRDDVVPGAAVDTSVTANARRVVDEDLERAQRPADRAGRTADHADRIGALITGGRDAVVGDAGAFTDEARDAAVRRGAGANAVVALGARIQIDQQHALAVNQPAVHRRPQGLDGSRIANRESSFLEPRDDRVPELLLDARAGLQRAPKLAAADAHELDVFERCQRHRPRLFQQETDLAGIVSLPQVRDGQLPILLAHRDFHVAAPDQVEGIARFPLARRFPDWENSCTVLRSRAAPSAPRREDPRTDPRAPGEHRASARRRGDPLSLRTRRRRSSSGEAWAWAA